MSAIEACRTVALGGHVEACEGCRHTRVAYNSCLMGRFSNGEDHGNSITLQLPSPPSQLTIMQLS